MDRTAALAAIRAFVERGEHLAAYDASSDALELWSHDLELQYLAALTLVRSGATETASAYLDRFDMEHADATGASPKLVEDIAALRAHIAKDHALAATGEARRSHAATAAALYEDIFTRVQRPYTCINAATLWLVGGDRPRAERLAATAAVLARHGKPETPEDAYWLAATEAEAALIQSDESAAGDALDRAAHLAPNDRAARAVTRSQLRVICEINDIEEHILAPLRNPRVIHFCGHRIARPGQPGRFPATFEAAITVAVADYLAKHDVGFGYGSLASGADIIVAEQLIARGAELHVVLPFNAEEFAQISVDPAGPEWRDRFTQCLHAATTVTYSTDGEYLDDPGLFSHCARIAMGDAVIRAAYLDTDVEQLAIYDGLDTTAHAGTAVDLGVWRASGRRTTVIDTHSDIADPPSPAAAPVSERAVRAMLFADVAGYSKLTESQIPAFVNHLIAPLGDTLVPFHDHIRYRNTWGDAIYIVFDSVSAAADCALALQETLRLVDLPAVGLPAGLGLRIGMHAGPVFELRDPIRDELNYYGAQVTRAARIEPRTPVGEVYVTHPFAALSAVDGHDSWSCQYVGRLPAAKDYGIFPMYVLKR